MGSLLSLRKVSLSYRRGRHVVGVLREVSLELCSGEGVAVLAPRAAGKTTLIEVAAGLLRPDTGGVLLGGVDLWGLSAKRRARLLAGRVRIVSAEEPDVRVPVLTYLATPLMRRRGSKEDAYARARGALERVGGADLAEARWAGLSDSERALVALAHGIAQEPELLLVDDLTATLGLVESEAIMGQLASVARERSIAVLATVSDAGATRWSDRIATLSSGELLMPEPEPVAGRENVIPFPGGEQAGGEGRRGSISAG